MSMYVAMCVSSFTISVKHIFLAGRLYCVSFLCLSSLCVCVCRAHTGMSMCWGRHATVFELNLYYRLPLNLLFNIF